MSLQSKKKKGNTDTFKYVRCSTITRNKINAN